MEAFGLPKYATVSASGVDLRAAAPVILDPGVVSIVPTGVFLEIPSGFEGQVRPRSGLAAKHGITVLNAPGTIDADYRGEVCVILINHGDRSVSFQTGDRIAQLVFAPVTQVTWVRADGLSVTERGEGGFGSTGTK
jgi:dUTP pyrophosphatase